MGNQQRIECALVPSKICAYQAKAPQTAQQPGLRRFQHEGASNQRSRASRSRATLTSRGRKGQAYPSRLRKQQTACKHALIRPARAVGVTAFFVTEFCFESGLPRSLNPHRVSDQHLRSSLSYITGLGRLTGGREALLASSECVKATPRRFHKQEGSLAIGQRYAERGLRKWRVFPCNNLATQAFFGGTIRGPKLLVEAPA